jgi:uncharacterized membrane-anchored protein
MTAEQFLASLKFQQGKITLPSGIAVLNLPASFRYLGPEDANRILVDAWGNPPGGQTLGMIFPSDISPLSKEGWGVIITYEEEGHVEDSDADEIDYDDLLKQMKQSVEEENKERTKAGYGAMHLLGWAEKPSYDKATHKYYWAKELAVEGQKDENSLNYNIRVLGRKGVLVLNAVAGMTQLSSVKAEMAKVIAFTNFSQGSGYTDFNPSTDKIAGYGLAALVAGGVAAKMGLFAKLFGVLLAFKKLFIVAAVGIAAWLAKIFKNKKK